jgi:plastocyanin
MQKIGVIAAALALAVFVAACGGSSSSSSSTTASSSGGASSSSGGGGGGQTLDVSADPSGALAYQQKSLTAKPGETTVDFTNDSSLGHDVAIEDSSGKTIAQTNVVTQGKASTDVNLKPGKYTFYCTVDSHRQAGMEGTLTVK